MSQRDTLLWTSQTVSHKHKLCMTGHLVQGREKSNWTLHRWKLESPLKKDWILDSFWTEVDVKNELLRLVDGLACCKFKRILFILFIYHGVNVQHPWVSASQLWSHVWMKLKCQWLTNSLYGITEWDTGNLPIFQKVGNVHEEAHIAQNTIKQWTKKQHVIRLHGLLESLVDGVTPCMSWFTCCDSCTTTCDLLLLILIWFDLRLFLAHMGYIYTDR